MKKKEVFLLIAEYLTGVPMKEIKVIEFTQDENGLFEGTIEIDGNREHIHEYI